MVGWMDIDLKKIFDFTANKNIHLQLILGTQLQQKTSISAMSPGIIRSKNSSTVHYIPC